MSDKQLKDKAIDIKGKKYILVSDRIIYFNDTYPQGSIETRLVSAPDAEMVVVKAKVTPDTEKPTRYFTGYSQAKWNDGYINKTSALENCETSAVGRALAMMGIGVIDSIASVDEINKAENQEKAQPDTKPCPKCKVGHLIEAQTKAGKKFLKCSKQTWNPETKTSGGCDYVLWDIDGKEAEAKSKGWDNDDIPIGDYN